MLPTQNGCVEVFVPFCVVFVACFVVISFFFDAQLHVYVPLLTLILAAGSRETHADQIWVVHFAKTSHEYLNFKFVIGRT